MKMKLAVASVALVGLLSVAPGYVHAKSDAQTKLEDTVRALKGACQNDLDKYCKDITPGEGRLAACLDSRQDQLSTPCKSAWTGTKAKISQRMDKAEIALRKSCGSDLQKYCSDVPSGRGRILDCLDNHKNDLSNSCQKFEATLDKRLADMLG